MEIMDIIQIEKHKIVKRRTAAEIVYFTLLRFSTSVINKSAEEKPDKTEEK